MPELRRRMPHAKLIESVWALPGLDIQNFGLDLTLSLGFAVEPAAERL